MSFYETQPRLYTLMGRTADRPNTPPDKHCLFWDIQLGRMWAVNDGMEWVLINAPFPAKTGMESLTSNFSFAASPSGLLMVTPDDNTFIERLYVDVQTPFTAGTTAIIGDSGDTDRLMKSGQIDLETVGLYEIAPLFNYPVAGTNIEARVSGGATDGFAAVYIIYDIDSQS